MPATETPATETAPKQGPFAAALDKAFKGEAVTKEPPAGETTPPPTDPEPGDKKTSTPRDLFKKDEKRDETTPAEQKSALDEIAAPEFKDEKSKKGWEALKGEAKKYETTAKAHEAKVKELEARLAEGETLKSQLAERDAKLKEYDEIVARARIEDHPDFRREFIDGREKLITRAKEIITESDGDPKTIETALNLKGKARVEALRTVAEGLDNFQSGRLGRVIDELADLDDRAQAKRDTAKKSYEDLKQQEQARDLESKSKRQQTRALEFDDTSRRLRGELEVLQKADGHDDWNARADSIIKEAKAYVDEHPDADPEAEILSRTNAAYRDLFLQADKKAEAMEKKIAELEKELKTIHGKAPSLGARSSGSSATASKRPFSDKLNEAINGGE